MKRLHRSRTLVLLLVGLLLALPLDYSAASTQQRASAVGWPPFRYTLGGVAEPLSGLLPHQSTPAPVALRGNRSSEGLAWTRDIPARAALWTAAGIGVVIAQLLCRLSLGLQWSRPLRGPPAPPPTTRAQRARRSLVS